MKIIAKTNGGYLLEADRAEVALMLGFRYAHDISDSALTIGTEMSLTKMAVTSEFVRTLDTSKIKDLKTKLGFILDELDAASETVQALTVFETLKE